MKSIVTLSFVFLLFWQTSAQCPPGRYHSEIFSIVDDSLDIPYGSAVDVDGDTQQLELDIYFPSGDTLSERPLVVLAFGGFFLIGTKRDGDVNAMCELYAKRGFACACIDYRLGISGLIPDSIDMTEALVRAVQDGNAAVRYFKSHVLAGNDWKIDTNEIYFGGSSAGGFIGLHMAALDDVAEAPTWIQSIISSLGGIKGNSGNPGFSSGFKGVLAYAGALKDARWLEMGDELLWMSHAIDDETVPYENGWVTYFSSDIIQVDGSKAIYDKALSLGLTASLITFPGDNHPPQLFNATARETTAANSAYFMYENMDCHAATGYNIPEPMELKAYPNPVREEIRISVPESLVNTVCRVQCLDGRIILEMDMARQLSASIDLHDLAVGSYVISLSDPKSGIVLARKSFQKIH